MKHRTIIAAMALAMCTAMLIGCSWISRAADKGESMMSDLESSLLGHENSQGNLLNDSSLNDSRLENSSFYQDNSDTNGNSSHLLEPDNDSLGGIVSEDGQPGTTNGINYDENNLVDNATDGATDNNESWAATAKQQLTEEEAIDIALREAGASRESVANLTAVLEYDDTTAEPYYEIDFTVDTMEYEYEISALDGSIIELDKERH